MRLCGFAGQLRSKKLNEWAVVATRGGTLCFMLNQRYSQSSVYDDVKWTLTQAIVGLHRKFLGFPRRAARLMNQRSLADCISAARCECRC